MMETIRVNMTPCEDIKTIHASQNDNEAREWGFELHNNGDAIDSSSISDQLVFKAYEGGTEEILPTNGSAPTTSPFKGDIKYPQGLLSDQEFLYRESPTEEDGLAKITDIKGNTLVWNQIFIPYGRTGSGIQSNVIQDGNDYSMRIYGTATASAWLRMDSIGVLPVGHKFLLDKGSTSNLFDINNDNNGLNVDFSVKTKIGTVTTANKYIYIFVASGTTIDVTVKPMLIDLTQMGLDSITSASDFTSLFSLPYYAYNQGTLLSFMGNGIKTVGFNQWDGETESGYIYNGITYASNDYWRTKNYIHVIPNETYYFNVPSTQGQIALYDANKVYVSSVNSMGGSSHLVTIPSGCYFARFYQPISSDSSTVCVNISSSRNGQYEPYTSSTLSLPISTYFTNGMKSAGNVYDELTETKAITRVGMVNLGDLNWSLENTNLFLCTDLTDAKRPTYGTVKANMICAKYTTETTNNIYGGQVSIGLSFSPGGALRVRDSSYNTASDFKSAMNGVYLYYELATPTESSFTTASLVTENGEIPLSNEDGTLIGKCTEELSENPGFFDAKIKLADEDGECYSNKIQLHIERSPQ